LGSSFAAGPGIAPVLDRGAGRSGQNYPNQLARALRLRLVDASCGGATTANIIDTPQETSTGTKPPQLTSVVPEAALVTITAGGNDLGYIGALTTTSRRNRVAGLIPRALRGPLLRLRGPAAELEPPAEQYAALIASQVEVVRRVREIAPRARILLVDYLTLVGPEAREGRGFPMSAAETSQVQAMAAGLSAAFAAAAAQSGVELVSASAASVGHGVGSKEPWVSGFALGIPLLRHPVVYHPTPAGMTAVAELIERQLAAGTVTTTAAGEPIVPDGAPADTRHDGV
jgi:lysophospholipase L1-like esterase